MTAVAVQHGAKGDGGFMPSVQGLRAIAALSVLMDHFYDMPKGGVYDIPNRASCRRSGCGCSR